MAFPILGKARPQFMDENGDPTMAAGNGSTYTKVDASDADDAMWMRIGGSWVALSGL